MTQIEAHANLDRWPSAAGRLVTLILTGCGLRISSALALDFDCLLHDGQGAPYLRYFNTKMRREAAVPVDEELEAAIRDQQRRVMSQWPDGTTCLFPRPRANVSGNLPLADGTPAGNASHQDHVAAIRLPCRQALNHMPNGQVTPKREDLAQLSALSPA